MKILKDNFNIKLKTTTYIALGSFDGLHLGHMKLIDTVIQKAKENEAKSLVFTFDNHPLTIINSKKTPKLIMNQENKNHILESKGLDMINYVHFNEEFMKIDPEVFIKNIVECYNVKGIVVGFNYRFGHKNKGDINLLKELSKVYNFRLYVIEPVKYNEKIISSSRIRKSILNGKVNEANEMLNRKYMISGTVVKGRQLGRTFGFPTANIELDYKYILPEIGVYYTNVEYNENKFKGITNIGTNPTVNGNSLTIETNILDFDENIYGKQIKLYFVDKIRNQKKFDSIDELINQLKKDKEYGKNRKLKI